MAGFLATSPRLVLESAREPTRFGKSFSVALTNCILATIRTAY